MSDKRAYFKLDVGYLTNPKIAAVLDDSPLAVILHVGSIAYAAQHLTDGVVPVRLLLRLTGASQEDVKRLLELGLWVDLGDGRAEIHDYTEHQRSAEAVKRAEAAGKKAALARWGADRNADGNADRMPSALGDAYEGAMRREIGEIGEKEPSSSTIADAIPDQARPDVEKICQAMNDSLAARGIKPKPVSKAWRTSARLLLDSDENSLDAVLWVINWAARDEFWSTNVLSVPKLRKQFVQLKLKAKAEKAARGPVQPSGDAVDVQAWMYR